MKLSRRILTVFLAVVMAASVFAFASCSNKNYAENNTKIKIGMTGPLTGGASIYGIAVKNSAELAVKEINEAGGLKVGDTNILFEFEMKNDEHDPTKVADQYAALYEGGMQVSLGTVTTKPGLEFTDLSYENNVFFLTPSSTGDDITKYSNGYQMCFSDSNQGTAAGKWFNENYVGKKIGVLYNNEDQYSTGIFKNFKDTLDSSFDISNTTATFGETTTDFASQIQILKNCDIVFMPIYYTPASQFMEQAKSVQTSISLYYGCDGFDGIEGIEGFNINSISQEISYLSHFNTGATEGPAKEFVDKYNAAYDEDKEPVNQFGAAAYDCVYAIYEALKVAVANGKEITANMSPSDMCDILTEVFQSESFVYRGITGRTEGNEKSYIRWNTNGTVSKDAIKYIVKEKNS